MKRLVLITAVLLTCLSISLTSQARVNISSISSDNQTGAAGYPLKKPFWMKLEENGISVKNHQITFRVIEGGGRMSIEDATTDGTGKVKSTLILGHEAGINRVEARSIVNGVSATKIMTATGIRPITDIFNRHSGRTSNIWRKFIGEDVPGDVPDLIDYSYAGYKNGEEPIPDLTGTIYDVTDYGAIPNDDASDTQAIKDTLKAAENGGIVFFPPGQYDVLLPGEFPQKITVGKRFGSGNIVLRGSGAEGYERNGTTIKMHAYLDGHWDCLFEGIWQHDDSNNKTPIVGEFPRGTRYFDVADSSRLLNRKFIRVVASGLFNDDWAEHSSRSRNGMRNNFTSIRSNGIGVSEFHEIDRIEGNRIYIKAPTTTPLNSNYSVYWKHLQTNIGFEDIHFDGNLQERYQHLVQPGRGWISLKHVAHSWVQRCRFSNSIIGVWFSGYGCSALSIIQDGRGGHYTAVFAGATYCLVGLLEEHTDVGATHGISITGKSSGNVAWGIGGPIIDGPDTHGAQPRNTLLDNYYSQTHESSSGRYSNLPHHLDGYTRWNNISKENRTLNMWTTSPQYFFITQSNMIGYIGGSSPRNAYVESSGSRPVYPNSLYEAQLEHRLGYLPAWIDNAKDMHNEFFGSIFGGLLPPPLAPPLEGRTKIVQDAIVATIPGISNADDVTDEHLSNIIIIRLTDKKLRTLKAGDFDGLTNLTSLYLDSSTLSKSNENRLTELPFNIFRDLTSLKYLFLNANKIESLPSDIFNGLDSLIYIYLNNNKLTTLPSNIFAGVQGLRSINLHTNELENLPENLFSGLTSLISLGLHNNQLTNLDVDLFSDLSNLRSLVLHTNNIENLPRNIFKGLDSINVIMLGDNELQELPKGIFSGLNNLTTLQLQGNIVDPIPLTIKLVKTGEGKFKADVQTAAPFKVTIGVNVTNGNIIGGETTVTIPSGKIRSNIIKVERSEGLVNIASPVTVDITSLPDLPSKHKGYKLVKDSSLPITVIDTVLDQNRQANLGPDKTKLLDNFPNPFNPETWIPYQLSKPANVTLTIYNMCGVVVRQLKLGQQPAGVYTNRSRAIHWDGRNEFGEKVAAAVYFYQLQADSVSFLRKMVILK